MTEVLYLAPKPCNQSKANVERFAEALAEQLEFQIGAPLEPVVERLGGSIVYGHSNPDEVDGGAIVASDYTNFRIYLSEFTAPVRDRFTIAHELGHLFLHLPAIKKSTSDAVMRATRWVDNSDPDQQRAEWEANWFAAGFLMPAKKFKAAAEHGLEFAAAKFNVSRLAAEVRSKSLN